MLTSTQEPWEPEAGSLSAPPGGPRWMLGRRAGDTSGALTFQALGLSFHHDHLLFTNRNMMSAFRGSGYQYIWVIFTVSDRKPSDLAQPGDHP